MTSLRKTLDGIIRTCELSFVFWFCERKDVRVSNRVPEILQFFRALQMELEQFGHYGNDVFLNVVV